MRDPEPEVIKPLIVASAKTNSTEDSRDRHEGGVRREEEQEQLVVEEEQE